MSKIIFAMALLAISSMSFADSGKVNIIHCDFAMIDGQAAPFWRSLGGFVPEAGKEVGVPSFVDSTPKNFGPNNPNYDQMIYCDTEKLFKDERGDSRAEITIRRLLNSGATKCSEAAKDTMDLKSDNSPLGSYSYFEYRFYINDNSDQRRHVIYISQDNEFPAITEKEIANKCEQIAQAMPKLNPCPWCLK